MASLVTLKNSTEASLLREELTAKYDVLHTVMVWNVLRLWELGNLKDVGVTVARRCTEVTAILICRGSETGDWWQICTPDSLPNEDVERLLNDCLPWSNRRDQPPQFSALPTAFVPQVDKAATEHGFQMLQPYLDQRCYQRPWTASSAGKSELLMNPPDGFVVGLTNPVWADLINDNWAYKGPNSSDMMGRILRNGLSMGITENTSGSLVAWYLVQDYGCQGVLFVLPEYRGKGLASCLLANMQKLCQTRGIHEAVVVLDNNEASRGLYQQSGFQQGQEVAWVFTRSNVSVAEASSDES